jgi:tetratricopeptide (TPR) repeat protein
VKTQVGKRPVSKIALKANRILPKPLPPPPKKPPSANALAAVRAFEQALKVFNRHGFAEARTAFDGLLEKFPDQAEVTAGARTYLAICEQRLSRAPSVPRDAESLYDQGVFQFNKGNTREAIDLYDKALRADPRADHVWYSLAAAYARQTDPSKALDALRRAIGIRSVHRSHARRDLDFAGLRTNHEFQQLTGFGFDLLDE